MSSWWHTPSGLIKESLWWWTLHWNRLNFLWISPTSIQETRSFYGFTSQSHAACGKFIHVCSTSLSGSWWVSRCCLGAQIVLKQTLMEKHEERMKCSEFARVITSKSFSMLAALGWNDKTQLPMPVVLARRILDQLQRLDVFCLRLAFGIVSLECANWLILPRTCRLLFHKVAPRVWSNPQSLGVVGPSLVTQFRKSKPVEGMFSYHTFHVLSNVQSIHPHRWVQKVLSFWRQ